ncbi:MAG: glycosyltransferase family 4 protein [Patescibacteria group bacterium]|nr:glycosyltransferase family 4 protein [Patescibacteria group bacterium]
MKRILIFSLAYYPRVGGAEVSIKEITDRIASDDIEFHMVTLRFSLQDAPEEKIGNVFVHRIGWGTLYFSKILFIPFSVGKAIQLHRKYKFDASWAMMSYMLLPIIQFNWFVGLPYALTLQEGDSYEHMFKRLRILPFMPLLAGGFYKATVVQVISTYLGIWARRWGFKGPLEIIPNGVDIQKFVGEKVPHEGTVLITTSRLVSKNAIDDIMRAIALLPQNISLVVVGDGPNKTKLKALAQAKGVMGRIVWEGYVDHAQLPALLHVADIFVRPSRSEGMGNSFIEAMASGLPVIATQEGGIADFLFDSKRNPDKPTTGWAVDKDSPAQIAEAVKDILAHPQQVKKVVENACAMVKEKYDWDLIAKDMREKVFKRVIQV